MYTRIIALPQGDEPKQPVIERAAMCAGRSTEITVLDVFYEPEVGSDLTNTAIHDPERLKRVKALAATLVERGLDAVGKAMWAASYEEAIEAYAQSRPVDLVVAAPLEGGRGGLSSGDWRLLSRSPAPVLMVCGEMPERKYKHIVAAVDPFHTHAKPAALDAAILDAASKLQAKTGATLTVLHCFGSPEIFRADARLAPREKDLEKSRRDLIAGLVSRAGIPAATVRVVAGETYSVLQAMAESGEADVIVMGALARGRIKDWVIGSTAERVLHCTRVDVLAVHPARASS
jgi:universal stress protein E